jgi:ferric enterobactin receptor
VNDQGKPYSILGEKNAAHLPTYHRLDVTATYKFVMKPVTGNVGISLVNVYNSKNILYYDRKTLQKITMLPFLPSAFIKMEF